MKSFVHCFCGFFLLALCGYLIFNARSQSTILSSPVVVRNAQTPSEEQQALRNIVLAGTLAELRWPRFESIRGEVDQFYQSTGYSVVWTRNSTPTSQTLTLLKAFRDAEEKGLSAEDYDGSRWDDRIAKLAQPLKGTINPNIVPFDVAVTVCAMRYLSDLHLGRTKPKLLHNALEIEHKDYATFQILQRIASSPDVARDLEAVEPQFPLYRRTADALRKYLALVRTDKNTPLRVPVKPIKAGDTYDALQQLQLRLQFLGDLSDNPSSPMTQESLIYQGGIVDVVKHFQLRHGLDADGVIGQQTFAALNAPISKRVTQLRLALERWRWLPHEFAEPSIIVNIPEFKLHAYDAGFHEALSMKVVVGKAYKHQTPVFTAKLKQVLFRPYWNVPFSIQRAELVPQIRKNADYMAKNNYEIVTHSGKILRTRPADSELIEQLRTGKVAIRQRPGEKNSLGLIKFVLPNPYDVYLHDTPSTALFSKARRDFSHGCIRVEKPVDLAEWLLRDQTDWTTDRIRETMTGDKTLPIDVTAPVPVLILYITAMVTDAGEVHFFEDIYQRDAPLEMDMMGSNRN